MEARSRGRAASLAEAHSVNFRDPDKAARLDDGLARGVHAARGPARVPPPLSFSLFSGEARARRWDGRV